MSQPGIPCKLCFSDSQIMSILITFSLSADLGVRLLNPHPSNEIELIAPQDIHSHAASVIVNIDNIDFLAAITLNPVCRRQI